MLNLRADARTYNFTRFTTSNGLAGDNVYCITQDKDGFIWIATETGLSRFDGNSFKNYTVREGLPSNDVNWLFVDAKNRMWMSPFKKEICYYYQGHIHNKYTDDWLKGITINTEEKSIAEDERGNLFFNSGGVITYLTTNDSCRTYPAVYTDKGFFKPRHLVGWLPMEFLDTSFKQYNTKRFERNVYAANSVSDDGTRIILEYSTGKRFLSLFKRDGSHEIIKWPANIISAFLQTAPFILLNTAEGSFFYNIHTKKITDTLLSGITVNVSYTDRDSGIWLGTNGAGLFYFPPNRSMSIKYSADSRPVQAYHFYSDEKGIWVGTNNWQLWKLDDINQVLQPVRKINEHLLYPKEGNLLKRPEKSILKALYEEKGGPEVGISSKSLMNTGDTLIGAYLDKIIRFNFPSKLLDSIMVDERLTCVFYQKGQYYAGTLNGFYALPKGTRSCSFKDLRPLLKGTINSIAYSKRNGYLWVTTSEDGVYCLNEATRRIVRHFNERNGLSGAICTCIFTDGTKVYIGTTNGLNIVDPDKDFLIERFYTMDGLHSNNITCIYAADNKVWAGTSEGLSCIDISPGHRHPFFRLNLAQITISGKDIPSDIATISLKPEDNNIRFDYSGVTFASMGNVQYRYRLRGLNDVWQTTDQRYLQYPSLPSGAYTLELYAVDRFNTRSNQVLFTFTIAKKWWEHGWVQFLGLLLLLVSAGSVLWLRMAHIQKRKQEKLELKEKIIELEQLALRAQMNPHFIFNSLNSFYQYVIDKDLEGASKFMSDFSHLIRLLFETTSTYEISLDKEIEFLSTYLALERTKLSNIFSYDIVVRPDIFTEEITIPSFVIQPFVENSIWHGIQNRKDAHGKIILSIMASADLLTISIDDNGVGRAYTDRLRKKSMNIHNSRGIALTEERIALYNKTHHSAVHFTIEDKYENGTPAGTLVIIQFPLKHIT